MDAGILAGPLPELEPGALPRLTLLAITIDVFASTLPPSWGASREVLPALQKLELQFPFSGLLPAEWALGFAQLAELTILGRKPSGLSMQWAPQVGSSPGGGGPMAYGGQAAPVHLLPEWAAGFPRLTKLTLSAIGVAGSIPDAWVEGGFPSLTDL